MEWLNDGQHVQKYSIDAYESGRWVSIAHGQAIGHKRIHRFAPVSASRVRLNILSSSAEAHIREFQIFNAKDEGN
jgi:alpha-L-fucosidase